ncbi:MAG: hypothetical protein QNI91_01280 [Arenicellales bacterium]|nr:hypothetical protein [Arenicellales bacterium]
MTLNKRAALLAVILAISLNPAIAADKSYAPCTPQTCPGLQSWQGLDQLLDDVLVAKNSARLAYSIGVSLLNEGCCFQEVVGYLEYAIRTDPSLQGVFYDHMNSPREDSWGLWTRTLLAVSSRLKTRSTIH